MSISDRYLSGNPFEIDELACYQSARQISKYDPKLQETPWGGVSQESHLIFKLAVVSICHQINWEFLQRRLAEKLLVYHEKDLVKKIANISSREIGEWFGDYHRPERIRASERASLLRNIGKVLQDNWHMRALSIFESCDGRLGGQNGFLELLDCFTAYREDSLRKKTNVLVHDLVRQRILSFTDMENIEPAIDYHIIRLYLRTGKVLTSRSVIFEQLKGLPRPRPRLVRVLRSTVAEALRLTANYAKLTIPDVNYIEWQIGRSICLNEHPLCVCSSCDTSIVEDVAVLFSGSCPYDSCCWALRTDRDWLNLQEPKYEKSYY